MPPALLPISTHNLYELSLSKDEFYRFEPTKYDAANDRWECKLVHRYCTTGRGQFSFLNTYEFSTLYLQVSFTAIPRTGYGKVVIPGHTPTVTLTFPPFEPAKPCRCPDNHPHNERGCYFGMCGCRKGRK